MCVHHDQKLNQPADTIQFMSKSKFASKEDNINKFFFSFVIHEHISTACQEVFEPFFFYFLYSSICYSSNIVVNFHWAFIFIHLHFDVFNTEARPF